MSKFKAKYEYASRFDNNVKRYLPDNGAQSSDDCDISQKIKNLELEGLKLRSQVEEILHETNETMSSRTLDSTLESSITPCDETGRHGPRYCEMRSGDVGRSWVDHNYEECGQIKGDQQVQEYRNRLEQLQHKLKQEAFSHNLEKERLHGNIEELKRANFRLQNDIEHQVCEFQAREENLHSITERMRGSLSQLLSVNKKQEEALLESGERLNELNGAESAVRALEHLRHLLIDMNYYRGHNVPTSNDVETSHPNELIGIVEKCFKEYNSDIDTRSRKIKDLEDEIIQIKRSLTHDKEKSLHDLRNQLVYLEEQNNYLKQHINEINETTDHEIERLRQENILIKTKMEEDMANATGLIDGLEHNLRELSVKNKKANESWIAEKKSFEKVLDNNEKQIAVIRTERDQAINQKSSLVAKLDATQNHLAETETTLLKLQSEKYSSDKEMEEIKKRIKEMEASIASSKKNFENIRNIVRSCGDNDNNANNNDENSDNSLIENYGVEEEDRNSIWKPKKYQIEETIHLIKSLSKREKEADVKYEKLKSEYESIVKQFESTDLQRRKVEQAFKAQQLDVDSAKNENGHITSLLANRNCEIERLTAERDYYFQLLNEKTEEVATIKTEKHRLAASLEERCRLLESKGNTNQNSDIQRYHTINNITGKDQIIREDHSRLIAELKDTKTAYEDLISQRDEDCRNLQKIRQENWNLQMDLKNAIKEYDDLVVENRKISMKLKESENEISSLCRELQTNNGAKTKKHTSLEKKISELSSDLTSNKNELKIAHDRIKYLEKSLSKSKTKNPQPSILNDLTGTNQSTNNLKVANNRLISLEQQMLTLDNTQTDLREENYKLTDLLKKVTSQNERMSEELETYVEENKKLRKQVEKSDTQPSYMQIKSARSTKKSKDKLDCPRLVDDKRIRHFNDTLSENYSNAIGNDESLKQLRQDLQGSIREAKRLLSNTPLLDSTDDNQVPYKDSDCNNLSHRSSKNQSSSGSNNNNVDNVRASSSDPTDSSTITTRRSDIVSLTEADRHISLPLNNIKEHECISQDERPTSPVHELLSPNKNLSVYVKRSNHDSYMLEEKIKRLLTTEG